MKKMLTAILLISGFGSLSYSNNNAKPNTSVTVKADKDAANLETDDITKWKQKLGVVDITQFNNINDTLKDFNKLNNISSKANSGVASAIATASNLKNIGDGKHTLSGSVGYYGKEAAGSIAYSTHYKNFGIGANASFNSRLEIGAGLGISYTFGKGEKEVINVVAPTIFNDNKLYENENRIDVLEQDNKELREKISELSTLIKGIEENQNKVREIYTIYGFGSNKFNLKEEQKNILDSLIEKIKNREVVVIGYTDTDGNNKYNLDLGLNRADSVKKYLENKGIKVKEIRSAGFNGLIRDNKTLDNKAFNRRVELIVE
ncbi:OmpA family protein [Streptobacillus moniliformis]|uniref:OmpA family protein n=1 Tax=Streptobacillus moniliformis TaxID=34105 RepID=UPI0007E3727C|nr:OmpA family protein [Streptobacillus moniliformis]